MSPLVTTPPLAGLKICLIVTVPFTVRVFLRDHIHRLVSDGHRLTLCLNMDGLAAPLELPESVVVRSIPIQRDISLLSDLRVLLFLLAFIREEQFDVVHSVSPKSGLIGMLAARLAGVRHRVHTFTGQVWVNLTGSKRLLLKFLDFLLAACATRVLADSRSQRDFLVSEGVVPADKISVLGAGSMCGVDVNRFRACAETRTMVRGRLGIDPRELLLLFVGRMKQDKGVSDLIEAFLRLQMADHPVRLLLVGHDEEGMAAHWSAMAGVSYVPYTPKVEEYFAAADVFCLPSYREGFGSVLIEAGAAGLPVVASRIYGITDAVVEGETGLLHTPKDIDDLTAVLTQLTTDSRLRRCLGDQGRIRAESFFRTEVLTEAFAAYYENLAIETRGCESPRVS